MNIIESLQWRYATKRMTGQKVLQLPQKGLRSSMLMAIGFRSESNDWNLPLKKVRKPMEELITYL